ncbi:hypothetical protein BJX63DRAFT_400946 [Aspergillus granulosus]|uniref:F-box domain-containing protein n=1 Tax=Aspergillus granulosus TaxID=176169 RepID=A0ABR4H5S0_9EURO
MPDPASLPVEIFTQILATALDQCEYDLNNETDLRQLRRLLTLNRRWYNVLLPRLYSKWTYNGARHTWVSLWKFVRTALSNRQLAEMVHTLNVGNWGFYPSLVQYDEVAACDKLELTNDDFDLMRKAIRAAFCDCPNLEMLESKILDPQSLANRDRRPLIILLLICLPNISTIYMHLPWSTPLLQPVLEEILRYQDRGSSLPCLRHLTHLYLLADVSARQGKTKGSPDASFRLDSIWPLLYFPTLDSLSLYGLDTDGAASLLARCEDKVCRFQHLRIVIGKYSTCATSDVQALVKLPRILTRFSIFWDYGPQEFDCDPMISVVELWDALQKHRESLEHLEVFYDGSRSDDYAAPGHFGLLQPFQRLQRLDTQLKVLLGGRTKEYVAPFRLKDTLPRSLEALVLQVDASFGTVPDFQTTELQAVIEGRDRPLKLLALGDRSAARWYRIIKYAEDTGDYGPLDSQGPEPYPGLRLLCKKETHLHVDDGCCNTFDAGRLRECHFCRGGACRWLWRNTWGLRMDGIKRSNHFIELIPKPDQQPCKSHEEPKKARTEPIQTMPFTDHRGKAAYMVFQNDIASQLPPLYPFVIYFTYPTATATPEDADLAGLYKAIRDPMQGSQSHFRLDAYFLPGASNDDCKAHYVAARSTRPDYKSLLQEFVAKARNNHFSPPPKRLPGMVYPDPNVEGFQTSFLICPERNWRDGAQRISMAMFDNSAIRARRDDESEEEYESNFWIESTTSDHPITWEGPLTEEDEGGWILGEYLQQWINDIEEDLQAAHTKAAGMGWTNW